MKVKVKGLVFVGFAAAILSANAMAAPAAAGNQNTVTSKAYTEATYQHKSTEASIGSAGGNWTAVDTAVTDGATSVPTTAAVKTYVDNQVQTAGGNYQTKSQEADENKVANGAGGWKALNTDIATTTDTGNGATTAAIKTYVADQLAAQNLLDDGEYQAQSTGTSVGVTGGDWKPLTGGTYASIDDTGNNVVVDIPSNQVTGSYSSTNWNQTGYSDNLVTEAAVAGAIAANTTATQYSGGGDTTVDNTNHTITTNVPVKGVTLNGTDVTPDSNGIVAVTDTTYSADGTTITKDANNEFSANTAAISGSSSQGTLVTGGQVYDYVRSQTGGTVIPAMDTTKCSASIPCALVAEASGEVHWRVMAVSEGQTPAAGTLADAQ